MESSGLSASVGNSSFLWLIVEIKKNQIDKLT